MANVILSSTSQGVIYFLSYDLIEQDYIGNEGETVQTTISVGPGVSVSQLISMTPANLLLHTDWRSTDMLPSRGSIGITSQIEDLLKQLRQDWMRIPKPAEVRDYLIRYPDLTTVLPFVCNITRERVGIYSELSLELYCDPEIEDEYLTLYVRQQNYDDNLMKQIKEIRTKYEKMLAGKSGWFLVTSDFRRPR